MAITNLEQAILAIEKLQSEALATKNKLDNLQELNEEQLRQARKLLSESERAQDYAKHAFKVDHNGFIWRWDLEQTQYVKTTSKICTPIIADEYIKTRMIADSEITSAKIANSAITSDKIGAGEVKSRNIAANAVTESEIGNGEVLSVHIAPDAVTTAKIADGNVTEAKIDDKAVTTAKIDDKAVTEDKINDGSVVTSKIADGAITSNLIEGDAVTTEKIHDGAVTTEKIHDGDVTTAKIANSAVATQKLDNGAVTTAKIEDAAVTTAKIGNGEVKAANIATGAVTEAKIGSGEVKKDAIAAGAVTTAKIADGNITTDKINNGAVSEGKLAAGAVNTSKISDNAVTTDKLANGAVTEGKINSSAVTADKIVNEAITESKLATGAVTTAKIVDANVTTPKIADGAVTTAKIANGAITEDKLANGAITTDKIADSAITELTTIMDSIPTEGSVKPVTSGGIKAYVDAATPAVVPMAQTLEAWADQKAIATPDTYTDAVRTTGGDMPIETSAGSKLESIKPVAGSKWTAKMLFNGSYNMLNAAKWGAANSQPYVGGVGSNFVYFLVPELTLGTFGTADKNNGLLFTNAQGENIQPSSVYFKPLGATVPQDRTDGTELVLQVQASAMGKHKVDYDGKEYYSYTTDGAGWIIITDTYYDASGDNGVCAHIAWEDWYDKYVSLKDSETPDPEKVVGTLILEGLLNAIHPNTDDKYLRGVNDAVCDNVVFGDTSATISHMVDEISIAANAWTNAATGESDSQGNALYRHSTTVSAIKQGGAACIEGNDGGIPLTVNGTTVSYIDTNAAAPASVVFYEVTATSTTKAYTDSIFSGSNINQETGVLPINDCSIEAQVAMDGEANITVKYAKNIVDQVAINAATDVPKLQEQVEEHEERITELEDTAVRTNSYDASVAVGLADNLKGDTVVEEPFFKRKTAGTKSVGSGIAAIKEVRGKSIVWNQILKPFTSTDWGAATGSTITFDNGVAHVEENSSAADWGVFAKNNKFYFISGHMYYVSILAKSDNKQALQCSPFRMSGDYDWFSVPVSPVWSRTSVIKVCREGTTGYYQPRIGSNNAVFDVKDFQIVDLTLMFVAGNKPATPEEFEKMFPLDYYDYNAGEVIPFAGQNLVTKGFNQWDEQWEHGSFRDGEPIYSPSNLRSKNFIPVFANAQYYIQTTHRGFVFEYDFNKQFIRTNPTIINNISSQQIRDFVTGENTAYIKFRVEDYSYDYNHDICINISNPDRNGSYEPYEKHTLPLDPSQWRDKQTGNLVFPYGGMHGVGTAYDYAKVDADGYIRKAVRCFEQVDLGSLGWNYARGSQFFFTTLEGMKVAANNALTNMISARYTPIIFNRFAQNNNVITTDIDVTDRLQVKDTSYNDASVFTAAMSGVSLIYELAEPVEIELATPVYAKYLVDKDGTEEITPANGSTPYTTMANLSILYAMDARGEIKNLPKNYLSKESAENMLNAMVSAGVIASYTMTYNAANARYQFFIVAPTQSNE